MAEIKNNSSFNIPISVVVLAGGKGTAELAQAQGATHGCLVEVGGKTVLSRLLSAFLATPAISSIIVVGSRQVLASLPAGVQPVAEAGSAADNLSLGLKACKSEWVLVTPADVPFLSPECINVFLQESIKTGADLVYPIVSKPIYEKHFPGGRRTYVALREGVFTGGNMVFTRRDFFERQLSLFGRLFKFRKNPIALARLLGFGFVFQLLLRRLTLPAIESRASVLSGGKILALPIARPELAFDIDKLEDLQAALNFADNQILTANLG